MADTPTKQTVAKALDYFSNTWARTGHDTPNLMNGSVYGLHRLTQRQQLLVNMYRNNWLTRRIIDIFPKDMMKNGWTYEGLNPDEIKKVEKATRHNLLKAQIRRGLIWGRLFGGAAGLMLIDGQEDKLDEPLDYDEIMPGDFKGLIIVDRWAGCYPQQTELVDDINDPEFGLPKYYEFRDTLGFANADNTHRVHHSRIVRFTGDDLPEWEKLAESYWGASKIESIYQELLKRDNTSANIALLIFQARLKILQMDGLDQVLTGLDGEQQADFQRVIEAQNWLMNNFSTMVMGNQDKFESVEYSFTGINDIYQSFMLDLSGATQIPAVKLFGRSPAGMNATGESDLINYYDIVEQDQENELRPVLEKLSPVMLLSSLGRIPDEFDFMFNPVSSPDEKTMAEIVKNKGDVILSFESAGIITPKAAGREAKNLSPYGLFTTITDEDIEKLDDEPRSLEIDLHEDDGLENPADKGESNNGEHKAGSGKKATE